MSETTAHAHSEPTASNPPDTENNSAHVTSLGDAFRQANPPERLNPAEYKQVIDQYWPFPTDQALELAPFHMELYYDVRRTGVPNYLGVRRQVPSQLECDEWDARLIDYHDRSLTEFLRYGWPVTYTAAGPPTPTYTNHASALRNTPTIDKFVAKELSKHALLGPFDTSPFAPWTQLSPLMTRDKPDGSGKRVIIDLSFPHGSSVNDGILKNFHQGEDFSYTLPSALDLANQMLDAGRGCFMWKADLERAYRQLRVDPLDYPLLAIKHKGGIYIDICPSFGCRSSSAAQQRVSNAVVFMMDKGGHKLLAYVDDFCGLATSQEAAQAGFITFHDLTLSLGLALAKDKTIPPSTRMEWLGYHFDSQTMEITIPHQQMTEVLQELDRWSAAEWATKTQLQSLAGRLNYISGCVRPARRFMNRILATLREAHSTPRVNLSSEFKKDVAWFKDFAHAFNRKVLIEPKLPCITIECDACPVGAGGCSDTACYDFLFPENYRQQYHISQLEAINAVMAIKSLTPLDFTAGRILVKTDNSGSMYALSTGRTKDPVLAACAREMWLFSALRGIDILITHTPGHLLVLADALSRQSFNPAMHVKARSLVATMGLTRVKPVALTCALSASL